MRNFVNHQRTILVDFDGTLSVISPARAHLIPPPHQRGYERAWRPYNMAAGCDEPHLPTIQLCRSLYAQGYNIVVWTSRGDCARLISDEWLRTHHVPHNALLMRAADDDRTPAQYKFDLLRSINPERVLMAIEDDENVAKHLRRLGVLVVQVDHT